MPRRNVELAAGEYYHIYNRGNNKQPIFFERDNYLYFLRKLRQYVVIGHEERTAAASNRAAKTRRQRASAARLISYCLMPNHYHLLVCVETDSFSEAMQSFGQSYTNAINKRFSRVGPLFQDRFKAIHVDREEYLLHLTRYIHLNPIRAGLVSKTEHWEFASYPDYVGLRQGMLCDLNIVLAKFPEREAYRAFVEAGMNEDDSRIKHLLFDET